MSKNALSGGFTHQRLANEKMGASTHPTHLNNAIIRETIGDWIYERPAYSAENRFLHFVGLTGNMKKLHAKGVKLKSVNNSFIGESAEAFRKYLGWFAELAIR
ncbi:MAG: hypothetical protein AAFV43_04295 [Planctomycetota bacterium]